MRMLSLTQNKLLVGAVVMAAFVSTTAWAQAPLVYSLEDCLEYCMQNQTTVRNTDLDRRAAAAQIGETRSDGLPQIDADFEYSNYFSIQQAFLPSIIFDPNAGFDEFVAVPFSQKYNGNATLSATQLLFDGSYFVGLKAAKTFKLLAEKDHIKSQVDVAEMITKAYYTVMVNEVGLELTRTNYQRLDSLLRETRALYENGFVEKIDVNRIQVEFNNAEVNLSRGRRVLELSYLLLKFQMGMPLSQVIQLAESIQDIDFQYNDYEVETFDYHHRIEIGQLQTTRELAQLDLKNNQVKYIPTISAFATLGANVATNERSEFTDFSDRWLDYGLFGLRLNVPIFDGLRKSYLVQQNRIQLAQIDNEFIRLKNSIDYELAQAKGDYANSLEYLRAQEENMKLAQEVFEATRIKYQEGVGSNLELVEADSAFKEAQTNYFNALYDALIAKVDVEKALGLLYNNSTSE